MRTSIFIFLLLCVLTSNAQTVGSDNFLIRNAAGSVSKPINMDSVTAYDAQNLGNQAVIGSLSDTILVTSIGVIKKLVGDAKINSVRVGLGGGSIVSNTVLGVNAGQSNTTGSNNSFIGYQSGYNNTTGGSNIFIGIQAGYNNTTGGSNIFIGSYAGYYNVSGSNNSFMGYQSGYNNTIGNNNSFIGIQAGYSNTTGSQNSFLGYKSGYSNTTGSSNSFMSYQSGVHNTTGSSNIFIGSYAGQGNTTGGNNSFIGYQTGYNNTTGGSNCFIGYVTGFYNTTGNNNSFIGYSTGLSNTTGSNNSFIGYAVGSYNTTGSNNLYVGYNSGYNNISGSSNTYLGVVSTSVTNESSRSNMLVLGTQSNGVYIFGDSTGAIGIGTNVPAYKLDVSADARFNGVRVGLGGGSIVSNTVVGSGAGNYNTTGTNNSFIGYQAGYYASGSLNSFIGYRSGYNTTGSSNVFIGYQSGYSNTTGSNNLFLGVNAGVNNNSGSSNTYLGVQITGITNESLRSNMLVLGTYNNGVYIFGDSTGSIGIGTKVPAYKLDVLATSNPLRLQGLATGAATDSILSDSAGVIRRILISQVTGGNTNYWGLSGSTGTNATTNFLGTTDSIDLVFRTYNTEKVRVSATGNVGIGTTAPAFKLDVSADSRFNGVLVGRGGGNIVSNTAVGVIALNNNTGNYNTAVGYQASLYNTSGSGNTSLGLNAGFNNTIGGGNTNLGRSAGQNNVSGGNNTFVGGLSGLNVLGSNSTIIGQNSGNNLISGSSNTYLGVQTTSVTNESSRSNMLVLGTYSGGAYIFGDSTGAIGIGTLVPAYKLDVSATSNPLRLQGLQTGAGTDSLVTSNGGILKRYGLIGNYVDQTANLVTITTNDTVVTQKAVGASWVVQKSSAADLVNVGVKQKLPQGSLTVSTAGTTQTLVITNSIAPLVATDITHISIWNQIGGTGTKILLVPTVDFTLTSISGNNINVVLTTASTIGDKLYVLIK